MNAFEQRYDPEGYYGAQAALQQAGGVGVAIRPPTKRGQLEMARAKLQEQLRRVEAAIEALDAHPELETFINVLQEAGV